MAPLKSPLGFFLIYLPANGLYFLVYEYIQDMAKAQSKTGEINTASTIFAGGAAGMAYWILGMPADVLKSRLQSAPEGTYKHGVRSVFKDLIVKDGPLALYRGVTPIMIRAFPANAACFFGIELANKFFNTGLYFLGYELLTDEYKRRYNRPNVDLIPAIFAGGIAGIFYWVGGMPADVLKSRLQTSPEGKFNGVRAVFADLLKNDGITALYRGFTPVIIRAFPANAATFFGIELANSFFRMVAPNF
ncbi:hypothetical protein ACLKA6_017678 [Drosophila palustris]